MFGEHSMTIKFQDMVEEMMLKVSLYRYVYNQISQDRCDVRIVSYTTERLSILFITVFIYIENG